MDATSLNLRHGLPDALRVLLDDYPRDGWAADRNFQGLVSFWLERHMMFRNLLAMMQADTQALLDKSIDPAHYSSKIRRLGGMFVNDLHGHHQIEDHHYFPILAAKEPRIARGFEILDLDHHAIDGHLDGFIKSANGLIQPGSDHRKIRTAAGRFGDVLDRFDILLGRHLIDEEELIVPIILRHGAGSLA